MKVLITGGTNGMGLGVARALAAQSAVEVVILGRSEELGKHTCDALARIATPERVSFVRCDLARLRDVRAAVDEIRNRHPSLDAIFVNAGLGYAPRRVETEDGLLEHFQVNYLAHFMLTLNLLDLLEASAHGGRVVFNATQVGELSFDNLQLEEKWSFEAAVGLGMVAKHLFYKQLHKLYGSRPQTSVSCLGFQIHKTVWSNQLNIIPRLMKAIATVMKWLGRFISIDECGATMAPLFTEDKVASHAKSGRFLTWSRGAFSDVGADPSSDDPQDWQRLWDISLDLCGDERTRQCAARLARELTDVPESGLREKNHGKS